MAGVVFHFEPSHVDVHSGSMPAIDAWIYAMHIPGDIDRAIVVNTSALDLSGLDRNFEWEYRDKPDYVLDGNVTHIDTPRAGAQNTSLWEFDHKTDWYVFGPAAGFAKPPDSLVYVPLSTPQRALHSVHVASIVMAHRYSVIGDPQ